MSQDQIRRRFWPQEGSLPTVVKRMKKLVEIGLLTQVDMKILKFGVHYYLTKQGLAILIGHGLSIDNMRMRLPEPVDYIRSDYQHNMRVTDIRIALELDKSIRVSDWVSDMEIRCDPPAYGLEGTPPLKGFPMNFRRERKFKNRIPDAIFHLEDRERAGNFILEYEHSHYARWKFRTYLAAWEERWEDYQKLIVTSTPERMKVIMRWCLRDLARRYFIELGNKKVKLEDLAQNYMFTDYDSLVENGLTNCGLSTPVGPVKLIPY